MVDIKKVFIENLILSAALDAEMFIALVWGSKTH